MTALLAAAMLLVAAPLALAWGGSYDGGSRDGGSYTGGYDGGGYNGGDRDQRPDKAVSYINPDTGAATANPNIDPNSSCLSPDRYDEAQKLSDPGTTNRNVHNDACFFGRDGKTKVDGPASFQSTGVGAISACPDPDGAGPKVAILSADRKLCFQSGYQQKGMAGDLEFHARMNNDSTPGTQKVVWCYDENRNGCDDERDLKDRIEINWTR